MGEPTVIYGDGTNRVEVDGNDVLISGLDKESKPANVGISRDAFREIVIGWNRLLEREQA